MPDPRGGSEADRKRVAAAFAAMRDRKVLAFISERRLRRMRYTQKGREDELEQLSDETELDMPDRRKLDDAVLRLLGVKPQAERDRMLDALYLYLRQHFEWVRQKEERAVANKKKARRKGPAAPGTLAAAVLEQVRREHPGVLRTYPDHFLKIEELFDTYEVPPDGEPELVEDLIHGHTVRFRRGRRRTGEDAVARSAEQAALVYELARAGVRGHVRVPLDADLCDRVRDQFGRLLNERQRVLDELVERQTGDPALQEKVHAALQPMLAS